MTQAVAAIIKSLKFDKEIALLSKARLIIDLNTVAHEKENQTNEEMLTRSKELYFKGVALCQQYVQT